MSKIYTPDPDVAVSGWLNFLDECLWIKYPNRTAILPRPNIEALYAGQLAPQTPTEKLLAANPAWLRFLLDHALGQGLIVEIQADHPLPKWNPERCQSS